MLENIEGVTNKVKENNLEAVRRCFPFLDVLNSDINKLGLSIEKEGWGSPRIHKIAALNILKNLEVLINSIEEE